LADTSDRKPSSRSRSGAGVKRSRGPENDVAMGAALRSVYQKTVEEQVPDEFLDLLGKLD
jgi:hypothetical protein